MSKTTTIEWGAFFEGNVVAKSPQRFVAILAKTAGAVHVALVPTTTFAAVTGSAGEQTWMEIFETVLNISDWLCVGIIVYSGITWMFANRTKAIEYLMGGSIGYIIIRHSLDIMRWLKGL